MRFAAESSRREKPQHQSEGTALPSSKRRSSDIRRTGPATYVPNLRTDNRTQTANHHPEAIERSKVRADCSPDVAALKGEPWVQFAERGARDALGEVHVRQPAHRCADKETDRSHRPTTAAATARACRSAGEILCGDLAAKHEAYKPEHATAQTQRSCPKQRQAQRSSQHIGRGSYSSVPALPSPRYSPAPRSARLWLPLTVCSRGKRSSGFSSGCNEQEGRHGREARQVG